MAEYTANNSMVASYQNSMTKLAKLLEKSAANPMQLAKAIGRDPARFARKLGGASTTKGMTNLSNSISRRSSMGQSGRQIADGLATQAQGVQRGGSAMVVGAGGDATSRLAKMPVTSVGRSAVPARKLA